MLPKLVSVDCVCNSQSGYWHFVRTLVQNFGVRVAVALCPGAPRVAVFSGVLLSLTLLTAAPTLGAPQLPLSDVEVRAAKSCTDAAVTKGKIAGKQASPNCTDASAGKTVPSNGSSMQNQPALATQLVETILGERCVAQERPEAPASRLLPHDLSITCEGVAVGSLSYSLMSTSTGSLADVFRSSRQFVSMGSKLDCEPPKSLTAGDAQGGVIAFPCRHRRDGWPTLVMVSAASNVLRVAEGPASAYPVLRQLSGLEVSTTSRTQQAEQVRSLWSTPIAIGSAAEKEKIAGYLSNARASAGQSAFAAAEREFRKALELQVRLYGEDDMATNDVLLDLAVTVSNQGRHDEAEALIRRAAPIVEKSPKPADRARMSGYQAFVAANKGSSEEALMLARAAAAQWRDIVAQAAGTGSRSLSQLPGMTNGFEAELAMALNLEAGMLLRTGDVTGAYAGAAEAALIIKRVDGEPSWWESDTLVTLGNVSSAQGRLSAAEAYLKKAIDLRKQAFGEGLATLQARVALGRAYQAEHMNVSAIIVFREAIAIAKTLPRDTAPIRADDIIPFAEAVVEEAARYSDPSAKLGLFTEVFDAFQMVSSPVFDRTMALTSARLSTQTPGLSDLLQRLDSAMQKEAGQRLQLATEQARSVEDRSAEAEEQYSTEIAAQGKIIAEVRKNIVDKFPDFSSLTDAKGPNLDQLRGRLGVDEGMLVYLVGKKTSFVQLVTRNKTIVAPVPVGSAALETVVARLRRGLEIEGSSVNDFDLDAAHGLYQDLFAGLKDEIADLKRLVIVPAGALANLPLGVLVTKPPALGQYVSAHWLTNDFDISYSPTITSFVNLRSTRLVGQHARKLLAVGNPVLAPLQRVAAQEAAFASVISSCQSGDIIPPELLRSLASLPDTANEIYNVSKALGGNASDILLGGQATEPALRARNLADYRILYFATHGLLPGEIRCQSQPGIVLTPPSEPAETHFGDGLFDASEIAALPMTADLVVLSACNTAASGKADGGQSLSGLAASFFRAGAKSLLVSHWQVPSAATGALMSSMFATLSKTPNMSVDTALRTAQLGLSKAPGFAHPFFWAAFVLMGDGAIKPLDEEQRQ
jgi:CHAT domain-containing protein